VDYLTETLLAPLPRLFFHNVLLAAKNPRIYAGAMAVAARRFARTRKSATLKHLLQAGYLVRHLLPASGVAHLHAHFAHSPTSVAMFASKLSGLPFSFTAHAKDIYTSDPRQIREKMALASFVVTCTRYNKRHLAKLTQGVDTPVHCVYHGIDLALFSGMGTRCSPEPPFRILTIARLTPKKGLPTVLKAVRLLKDQGVDVVHDLIGDGEDRDTILSCVDQLALGRTTRWLGTLPHHQVIDHYRKADVFALGCEVAPNGDRDGIPNVLVESMAMGVPVVATGISAVPEIVSDGATGLLVPPGQPEDMARAIQRLLTDTRLRSRIIPAARARVAAQFDNRKLVDDLAAVYRAEGLG
jgi:glycosyltransferase involved in cell wall biosynthesis